MNRKIKRVVHLVVELPDVGASDDEIKEFIEFETGFSPHIKVDNPFESGDMEVAECYIENKEVYE